MVCLKNKRFGLTKFNTPRQPDSRISTQQPPKLRSEAKTL